MELANETVQSDRSGIRSFLWNWFAEVPLLGWLLCILAAVLFEYFLGDQLAEAIGLGKVPGLFGIVTIVKSLVKIFVLFKEPSTIGAHADVIGTSLLTCLQAILFFAVVYVAPIFLLGRYLRGLTNALSAFLLRFPLLVSVIVHLALVYLILHIWSDVSQYRLLTVKFTLIAVMLTLSLNLINGYMGEFSCSHPGFMALGAYVASVLSVLFFVDDRILGKALTTLPIGPWVFPIILIIGGLAASVGALIIAIPSFRTRGDYLAIISLAFLFIVKSLFENLEVVGGPRGLMSQPDWANLPTVFIWTVICIWVINNFTKSILGKALNAVRDDETAAEAMTVNTRRTKMVAFTFGAFWAGVAGGLFAHVIRFINPATFGLQKLAEVLAMVYFGGLNSVYGSIVGAVSISILGETLRPLEIFKWIVIPLLLILVMIYRPTGLIAFKEFNVREVLQPRRKSGGEV